MQLRWHDYAIRQVRAGRRVGCRQNMQDIMSPVALRTRVKRSNDSMRIPSGPVV